MTDSSRELLRIALSCAVPLHAADLVKVPLADLIAQAPSMGQYLAEHGDRLMFRSKAGETREAFTTFAKAIAILSFAPGGVTFLGDHYEFGHPDSQHMWSNVARKFIVDHKVDVASVARSGGILPVQWGAICSTYTDERHRAELARAIVQECERKTKQP